MDKHIVITVDLEKKITLEELCEACQIEPYLIYEMISFGAIEPKDKESETLFFDQHQLQRIQRMQRLQRDFEVNLAGAVLANDLLEQLETLRAQVVLLHKLLK